MAHPLSFRPSLSLLHAERNTQRKSKTGVTPSAHRTQTDKPLPCSRIIKEARTIPSFRHAPPGSVVQPVLVSQDTLDKTWTPDCGQPDVIGYLVVHNSLVVLFPLSERALVELFLGNSYMYKGLLQTLVKVMSARESTICLPFGKTLIDIWISQGVEPHNSGLLITEICWQGHDILSVDYSLSSAIKLKATLSVTSKTIIGTCTTEKSHKVWMLRQIPGLLLPLYTA